MNIFIILLVATLLELYVIISVGNIIGAGNTIILVILTALIGSFLLKQQGRNTLSKAQQKALSGQVPIGEILEGVVLLVSGVLLLTPGFITDIAGLLGLLPLTRQLLINYLINQKIYRHFMPNQPQQPSQSNKDQQQVIIETDFWETKR